MKQALRSRCLRDDDGLTLVEMVVALFLVSLVLMGFTSLAIAGAGSSRVADFRNRANQVGNQEIERLKAMSWDSLGLYDGDTTSAGASVSSVCGTAEPLASLGAAAPSPRLAPALQRSASANGRSFTVTDCITWRDDPSDGTYASGTETDGNQGKDIKHVVVTVSWTVLSKTRSVTYEALRTPTAIEVPPVAHTTASLSLSNPSTTPATQQLAADYSLTSAITIQVTASLPATGVTATWTGRAGPASLTLTSANGGTTWTGTIPAGSSSWTFNPGATTFTLYGQSTAGNAQTTVSTNLTAPPTPLTVATSASPTTVSLTSSNYLASPITLTATTSIAATSVTASIPTASGSISRSLTSTDQIHWTYTLAADTTSGPYTATSNELISFTATATGGSTTGTASVTLTAYSAPAVLITGVSVAEHSNRICAKSNGQNDSFANQTLVITAQNVSVNDTPTASYNSTTWATTMQSATSSSGTVTFYLKIPSGTKFPSTPAAVIVTLKRTSSDNVSATTPQQNLTVYYANNSGGC